MTIAATQLTDLQPRSILMLKAHSAGVGDILRSSAAWRALHDRFPGVQLHLWFLTREPGYASEQLMSQHHLLASFHVSDKRTRGIWGWPRLWSDANRIARQTRPDLVVDFEPGGLRTSVLARWLAWRSRAWAMGIAQEPMRRWFYDRAAPSSRSYARGHQMSLPMEYAERDFVALAPLGIERKGIPIELRETEAGRAFRQRLRERFRGDGAPPLLGLNIGCGTPGAAAKRPNLDLLAALVRELQQRHHFGLVLTGAPFEQDINRDFLARLGPGGPVVDLAGQTNLLELTGAIAACRLFVSSDSGPYHMAVGLRVPTLALFTYSSPEHYHHFPWVESQVAGSPAALPAVLEAAERLLLIQAPN